MGTSFRNLVSTAKAQKESISGKEKLTKQKITKMQNYESHAIKDNRGTRYSYEVKDLISFLGYLGIKPGTYLKQAAQL